MVVSEAMEGEEQQTSQSSKKTTNNSSRELVFMFSTLSARSMDIQKLSTSIMKQTMLKKPRNVKKKDCCLWLVKSLKKK